MPDDQSVHLNGNTASYHYNNGRQWLQMALATATEPAIRVHGVRN
jgi:hypothetical protein